MLKKKTIMKTRTIDNEPNCVIKIVYTYYNNNLILAKSYS